MSEDQIVDQAPIKRRGGFKPGVSGNPAGRPVAAPSEALRKYLATHSSELLDIAIAQAKAGDTAVLMFLLARLVAPLKPVHAPLNLGNSDNSPLALANSLIVEAVASGNSPDSALAALGALNTLVNVQAQSDLQARLEALEQRLLTVNGN